MRPAYVVGFEPAFLDFMELMREHTRSAINQEVYTLSNGTPELDALISALSVEKDTALQQSRGLRAQLHNIMQRNRHLQANLSALDRQRHEVGPTCGAEARRLEACASAERRDGRVAAATPRVCSTRTMCPSL